MGNQKTIPMKRILIYFLSFLIIPAYSQNIHSLRGEIKNAGGKKVFLSAFYGEKVNRIDSVTCDAIRSFHLCIRTINSTGIIQTFNG